MVGILLVVAIVVVLAAVVGQFAIGTANKETTPPPTVSFGYEYDSSGSGELTITVESGDEFEVSNIEFEQADGDSTSLKSGESWPSTVTSGDQTVLKNIDSDDTVRIVWIEPREDGKTVTLGTWDGTA